MSQYLTILGDNIDSLYAELRRLEYMLAFIRASSTPHSVIDTVELKTIIDKLRTLYHKDEVLDLEVRDYYDIIKLGYFYRGNQIVIVFKVPIAYPIIYYLYKLSIVPNKFHKVLIPTLPFIAISGKDSLYIEAECPKVNSLYLCDSKTKYHTRNDSDCIHHLIVKQEIQASCNPTTVILKTAAVEQFDEKHYTISFPDPTKVKILCGQETYRILSGSFLAIIPHNCYIQTPDFTLVNSNDHIKGYPIEIMALPQFEDIESTSSAPFILNSVDLGNLHDINTKIALQAPVQLKEDDIDTSIYHTTIPIYLILFGIITFTIAAIYRSRRALFTRDSQPTVMNHQPPGIYTEINETSPSPRDIKVGHSNISSSHQTQISK